VLPGSVAFQFVPTREGAVKRLSVEHPSGEFSLEIGTEERNGEMKVVRSSLIRTARALFRGDVLVPAKVWDGKTSGFSTPRVPTKEPSTERA
jgi:4-oxalomesaconate tautomerase